MVISVPREVAPGERRVAVVPATAATWVKQGHEVRVEQGAGAAAGFTDPQYQQAGATIVADRARLIAEADILLQVRTYPAHPGPAGELEWYRHGQAVIGFADPLTAGEPLRDFAGRGAALLAMELMPRITRAQSMDALSSQANIAGFKAVILAAQLLPKIMPMMMTAAGTIQPARAFVIGAGVAGLQAIATAKRLGAVVTAFDVRAAVKEQVQSLGARFLELDVHAAEQAGYAAAQSEEQIRHEREMMAKVIAESDMVITTALIPGQKAPTLITAEMVGGMSPGSVIVDMAAERGGNCELTQPGRTIDHNGVTIVGETNLASLAPHHASQMYSHNLQQFLKHLVREGKTLLDPNDEIVTATLVCMEGQVVHPKVRQALGLPEPAAPAEGAAG